MNEFRIPTQAELDCDESFSRTEIGLPRIEFHGVDHLPDNEAQDWRRFALSDDDRKRAQDKSRRLIARARANAPKGDWVVGRVTRIPVACVVNSEFKRRTVSFSVWGGVDDGVSDDLKSLSVQMRAVSEKMKKREGDESASHAEELFGAAELVEEWAAKLERPRALFILPDTHAAT